MLRLTINNKSVVLVLTTTFPCLPAFISKKNYPRINTTNLSASDLPQTMRCFPLPDETHGQWSEPAVDGISEPGVQGPACAVSALRGLSCESGEWAGPGARGTCDTHRASGHSPQSPGNRRTHCHCIITWVTSAKFGPLCRQKPNAAVELDDWDRKQSNNQVDICNSIRDVRVLVLVQTGVEMET